ncbi:MAG TPA: DUF3108 domain-containing protein [Elusimicrobiota bacterium]|nr:DUF3108 domain-containing protein [Elusimicrobiota bacterium]
MKPLFLVAVSVLAACSVQHRATDPQPTLPSLTPAEVQQPLPAPSPALEAALVPAAVPPGPAAPDVALAAAVSTGTSPVRAAPSAPAAPPAPEPAAAPSPAAAVLAPAEPAPAVEPAPARAGKKRTWGYVAITTAIVSPSQLMGPEVPMAPDFQRLPVFPEKLTLAVSWGLLSVGEATMSVSKIVMFNGRPAYHLVTEARSNSFCDTFYSVRDLNESWLDARTLTSLGYSKKLREGGYYRDVWVLYDRDAGTFLQRQTRKDGTFEVKTGTIPAQVQDILSSVYYVRAHALPDGAQVVIDVNTPDNWPLVVKVTDREKVKVPAGTFPSVLVEPAMRREGLFIQKGKRLRLWLSDDPAKRPLMMKVEVFFGHVTAVLREMV